tara:strand:- start:42 stop:332 length:291 start_codon:yes stop_codon:yes gene_type:complete
MRITKEMLENKVRHLNNRLGLPNEVYKPYRDGDNKLIANEGTYYIAYQYGRCQLERVCKGGGATDISFSGSKAEIYNVIKSIIEVLWNLEDRRLTK